MMLKGKGTVQMMMIHCLCWIFPTQIARKPARLQCVIRHARVMSCMLPGKTSRFTSV